MLASISINDSQMLIPAHPQLWPLFSNNYKQRRLCLHRPPNFKVKGVLKRIPHISTAKVYWKWSLSVRIRRTDPINNKISRTYLSNRLVVLISTKMASSFMPTQPTPRPGCNCNRGITCRCRTMASTYWTRRLCLQLSNSNSRPITISSFLSMEMDPWLMGFIPLHITTSRLLTRRIPWQVW